MSTEASGVGFQPSRKNRGLLAVASALGVVVLGAVPVLACSTGFAPTVRQIGSFAPFIVVADVLDAPDLSLRYELRIVEVIRGDAHAGDRVSVGAASSASAPGYPDCWLRLVVGQRIVVALTDRLNLDALASYAWWEEGGHVVSASAVEGWPDSITALVTELRAGASVPATDTMGATDPAATGSASVTTRATVIGATTAVAFALAWRRARTPEAPQSRPTSSIGDPSRPS